jgi:hypothetical protein
MLLRALKKVQTTEDAEKLCAACGQAFFCGKCFAKDGAPPELDVLRVLGRACHQVGLWSREHIADQLRDAFRAGETPAPKEDPHPQENPR